MNKAVRERRPHIKMMGMLGEAWRGLITGTSHACALAVGLAGVLISSPLLAWAWLENGNAEALALTDTLLRVPISAVVGVLVGALVAVLSTRESHLLKYFKNR